MSFRSILFGDSEPYPDVDRQVVPECFHDLHLDQIVSLVTSGRDEYNLRPYFCLTLKEQSTVAYRHGVFRELAEGMVLPSIHAFANGMRQVRTALIQVGKLAYARQKQVWLLDAADTYCRITEHLAHDVQLSNPQSLGFRSLSRYLNAYVEGSAFVALKQETSALKESLKSIKYSLDIVGTRIFVGQYNAEPDYGHEVLETFERFKQGPPKAFQFNTQAWPELNHVEAGILELVTQLYPDIFRSLEDYFSRRCSFLDETITRFDREIQFYLAYQELIHVYRCAGLNVNYPSVSSGDKHVYGRNVFDFALAYQLIEENHAVVINDFELSGQERILVVSGPNQGGKTTFARTFGQMHYLANLGCPVAGTEARLFLFDKLFSHFEKEEDLQTLSGKLEDDLRRIHRIIEQTTPRSILIMNESFASTSLSDALYLNRQIMAQIVARDMLCVSVTFLDELASFSAATVSMVSTVLPQDTSQRTFKILRRPADGLAYAAAIAAKYRLTYTDIKRRLA